jgi:trehalose/maltose hydrolase-like predicted phosphorylase
VDNIRQTFSTVSGFYDCQPQTARTNFEWLRDRGCESVISGLPHPMGIYLTIGNETLDSTVNKDTISNFTQTLSFRDGTVSWSYTWSPIYTDIRYDIKLSSIVSRDIRNVAATQLFVTPRGGNSTASVADFIDGREGVRSFLGTKGADADTGSIYVSVHPEGLPNVTAWLVSTMNLSRGYVDESSGRIISGSDINDTMSISQMWDAQLVDGETAIFEKFIGISSTDGFPMDAEEVALNASTTALATGWDDLYSEHVKAWNSIMDESSITSFRDPTTGRLPLNDSVMEMYQIQEIASRYFLLANLQQEDGGGLNDNGIAVGGLTSDTYAGNLFWDQDFWIYPGLALTHPDYASQIVKSRDKGFEAAKANAQEAYVQEKYNFDKESSLYPWLSGRFGNATANGPVLDYEYHLNAVIALSAIREFFITGNETAFKLNHWERVKSAVHTFMGLVVADGDGYSIRNVTEPDEYAVSFLVVLLSFLCMLILGRHGRRMVPLPMPPSPRSQT